MLLIISLTISSILGTVLSETPSFIWNECSGKNSYLSGSAFEVNLNVTLSTQLLPNANTITFSNATNGLGEDQVYALFYCRGDLDTQTCHSCVEAATKRIIDECEFQKEGIVWYEECTLRYANRNIFSVVELAPSYLHRNTTGKVTEYYLEPYKEKFDSEMTVLIQQAAAGKGMLAGFATNEVVLTPSAVIRGLAQCTPDIGGPDCHKCLKSALKQRDSWANTIVFLPSCLFRYDFYGILPNPPPAPPPADSPPLPPRKALFIVLIVVLLVVLITVVIGGLCLWKNGCSQEPNDPPAEEERVHGLPKYTFAQVEQMTNGFERQIGKGGFGVVYHGHLLDGSREVAVKMLNENDAPKQFSNEIDVFALISHRNLVSLLGYCEEKTKLALIYEYMDKGDLKALLSENAGSLSWTDRLKIAIDTAEGLHYLHKSCTVCIVHRDVKPANILLSQNLHAKVADFGLSKIFPANDVTTLETRVIGTHGYRAPEYAAHNSTNMCLHPRFMVLIDLFGRINVDLNKLSRTRLDNWDGGYTATGLLNEKADVYSFGVVLLELITGITPRLGFNLVEWSVKILKEGNIEKVFDQRLKTREEETMDFIDRASVWGTAELARACVEVKGELRPDMWNIIVTLKQCLDMEVKKNAGNSQAEIENPVVLGNIAMGPEQR